MHYERRYSITPYNAELHEKMEELGMKCEFIENRRGHKVSLYVDVDESHPNASSAIDLLPSPEPSEQKTEAELMDEMDDLLTWDIRTAVSPAEYVIMVCSPVYTKDEYKNAKWLRISSLTSKGKLVENREFFSKTCQYAITPKGIPLYSHLRQNAPVELERPFKWGNTQFFCYILFSSALFCDNRAKAILENSDLRGIEYEPVYHGKNGEALTNVFQISAQSKVPEGAFVPVRDMHIETCPLCGHKKLLLQQDGHFPEYRGREELFPTDTDICWTSAFDWEHDFFISQKMYQFLKAKKMLRGLWLEPLFPLEENL